MCMLASLFPRLGTAERHKYLSKVRVLTRKSTFSQDPVVGAVVEVQQAEGMELKGAGSICTLLLAFGVLPGSFLRCTWRWLRKFPYDPAGGLAQSSQGFANLSVLKTNSKHVANAKWLWSSMICVCVKECRYQHVLHDLRGAFFHLGSRKALLRNLRLHLFLVGGTGLVVF